MVGEATLDGLPLKSWVWTVMVAEQALGARVCTGVMNASCAGAPAAVTVGVNKLAVKKGSKAISVGSSRLRIFLDLGSGSMTYLG